VLGRSAPLRIAVVGGGAGGVELVLSIQHGLAEELRRQARRDPGLEYHLFAPDLLPGHNRRAAGRLESILARRGIHLHHGVRVNAVEQGRLRTDEGIWHAAEEVLWVTDAAAASWLGSSGLAVDDRGFVRVDATLRSISHAGVFAAGDAAAVDRYRLPKAGVVAVRQGPLLADNLRRALSGRALRPYVPQRQYLSLISTGDRYAVASRGPWAIEGRWVWSLKDWIDRRFVERYRA
jgi:selenide,water dikinase